MSKDPRDGLKLRLGYEVARDIERTPVIALGVSDAAVRAVNSVLYQRLQDQIIILQLRFWRRESGISTSQTLHRRTTLISRTSLLFCNLVGSRAHLETRGHLETKAIKVLLELRVHLLDHREDQDLDGHRGLVDQGVQFLWMRHPTPPKDLPMIHHRLHHRK